jgi:polyphosphate kinase
MEPPLDPHLDPTVTSADAPMEPRGNGVSAAEAAGDGAPAGVAADFALPQATRPHPVPPNAPLDHPSLYFNRELSWLDFNWRVFAQALDERTPLLERVRFVAITANNLDEFYRKRIGGLQRQHAAGVRVLSPDGRTPKEQLDLILGAAGPMQRRLCALWEDGLRPRLAEEAGVVVRDYASLAPAQRGALDALFRQSVFPILTPLAVDPGHPFPFISNLSLSLAVMLRHPARGTEHFARLKVPTSRGRWLPVPDEPLHFVPIEEVIRHNAESLFRGMEVEGVYAFRVTRNADVGRNEEEADDLLALISEELRERKFAEVVRLEVEAAMPPRVRQILRRELDLEEDDVVPVEGLLDLTGLFDLADLDLPEHQYPRWEPVVPARLRHPGESEDEADIFSVIRSGDLLAHHPYESFAASVLRFLEEAAVDPAVLAIKMTLYRTDRDSPIVRALLRASENGKQVAVLIEVKARFDEENNVAFAQLLEKAGVHVTYGLVGLKTHCKTTLVVREEPDGLRLYCHLGTGNYNLKTARLYTDVGLLTCDPAIGTDLVQLFHYLTGYAPEQHYETLIVAPRDMRARSIEFIRREVEHQRNGGTGRIIAKMNALDDPDVIQELYRASQAGVRIDLIVRGHCRLRPGLPGYSENIRVLSIIGRFLEHSRIFHFHNGGDPLTFIASGDWQRRNLEDRVETMVPIKDEGLRGRLVRTLAFCLDDNRLAWDLQPDGRYVQRHPRPGEPVRSLHDTLMGRALARSLQDDVPWDL